MPLTHCSLIGIDETTPLVELAVVSDMYPYAEWGFLYAPRSPGAPGRYPSVGRIRRALKELPPYVRIALHVGDVAVAQLLSGEPTVSELVDQLGARGGRVQLSFDAAQVPVDLDRLRQFVLERPGLTFIVPLVGGNRKVIWTLAGVVNHAILLDGASGPGKWPPADEPVPCGYTGGLGPESLAQQLPRIYEAAGSAEFWIAMDGRLRDEHDRFSMTLARKCLEIVSAEAAERLDVPACVRSAGCAATRRAVRVRKPVPGDLAGPAAAGPRLRCRQLAGARAPAGR